MHNQITCVVDVVLLTLVDSKLSVALFQRQNPNEPAHGQWALPGGFIRDKIDESVLDTAQRVLMEKAGLEGIYLEQLQSFSGPERDPDRGWTLSVAHVALVPLEQVSKASRGEMKLVSVNALRSLPFDHKEIINAAVARVRTKSAYSSLPAHLLADEFTIPELQVAYEAVLGQAYNSSSFRRKLKDLDAIEAVSGQKKQVGLSAPAQIYRLKKPFRNQLATRSRGVV